MKAIPVLIQFHQMRQLKAAPSQAAIAMSWWSTEIAGCFTNSLAHTNKRVGVGMQNGAIFNMTTGTTRPAGWTSADAAGLPILPGLVRYDEVSKGAINHALRFTVVHSRRAYIAPARHFASSSTNVDYPPMGMRVRLKANFNISGFPASAGVVLTALKKYGMFVADNGSNWFFSGSPDPRWKDDELNTLKQVKGSNFEVIEIGPITAN